METNGNHDKNAIGEKMSIPIPASYILANSLTESHKPRLLTILFHVMASCFRHPKKYSLKKVEFTQFKLNNKQIRR